MANLDKEKARVYETIANVIMKLIFAVAMVVAFFIILAFLIKAKTPLEIGKFSVLETILTGTMYVAVMHFFPKKK